MIYGVSGSHGTGKTTLCQKVAEEIGIEFVPTNFSQRAKEETGIDPVSKMTLEERLILQTRMLALFSEFLGSQSGHIIVDRTPIDMLAYTLGELTMNMDNARPELLALFKSYEDTCMKVTSTNFDCVFGVSRLPFYEELSKRPMLNPGYQSLIHYTIVGAMYELPSTKVYFIPSTDLDERVSALSSIIRDRIIETEERVKKTRYIN